MGGSLRAETNWDTLWAGMMPAYFESNPGERGVTEAGIDNLRRSMMAQRRAQAIAQIAGYDLDGDGSITTEEITAVMEPRARQVISTNGVQLQPTPEQIRLQLNKLVAEALKPDTDRDGIISPAELQKEAQSLAEQTSVGWQQSTRQRILPMILDANGDGAVSLAEYEAAVRAQFKAIDQDGDGRISAAEFGNFGKRLSEANQGAMRAREAEARRIQLEASVKGCEVVKAPAGVRLILLGARYGQALSNTWVGSEDRATYVTTVEVASGPEPLYLALTSHTAMIWDIVGAVERIDGMIAHSETAETEDPKSSQRVAAMGGVRARPSSAPFVGVMGVPREKVRFTAHSGCLTPPLEDTMKNGSAQDNAVLLFGRAADELGGEQAAGTFRVPAARHFSNRRVRNAISLPKDGAGSTLWAEVEERYPAGIAQIQPASVVSAHPVKRYAVLPTRAGLAEHVDSGAIVITGLSRGIRINDGDFKPFTSPNKFRIMEKIRMPADVGDGEFSLMRGTPTPDGDLSNVCIISEVDKKPINGGRSRC